MCKPTCKKPSGNQAHCACCHETFSGPSLFDMHRDRGRCLEPSIKGALSKHRGVWGTPEGHAKLEASLENMRLAREGR